MSKLIKRLLFKSDEEKANKAIASKIGSEAKKLRRSMSTLLLGAGGSGKSTILKQMEKIHNGFIEEKDMEKAVLDVRKNIVFDICDLCEMNLEIRDSHPKCQLTNPSNEPLVRKFASQHQSSLIDEAVKLDPPLAQQICQLWADEGIRNTYEIRKLSHVMDNTPWLLDRVETIADPGYEGSFDAYVRVRDRTTGVINCRFLIELNGKEWIFEMTDVGGQRAERRKWLKLFRDNISSVLYVMSLSAYDQVLYEDNKTRCYDETFKIFGEITRTPAFQKTDFVVFLNKVDIFDTKIDSIPFTKHDPNFPQEFAHDRKQVVLYVQKRFHDLFVESNGVLKKELEERAGKKIPNLQRDIHFHVTCAMDTKQIEKVIVSVQTSMVQRTLRAMNLT